MVRPYGFAADKGKSSVHGTSLGQPYTVADDEKTSWNIMKTAKSESIFTMKFKHVLHKIEKQLDKHLFLQQDTAIWSNTELIKELKACIGKSRF